MVAKASEILQQLIGGKHPIILSWAFKDPLGDAGFRNPKAFVDWI
jgi:hypothetical protein